MEIQNFIRRFRLSELSLSLSFLRSSMALSAFRDRLEHMEHTRNQRQSSKLGIGCTDCNIPFS